ncbi:MAG: hypothetical protein L7T84_04815 [Akkermansiaceae bacterium]|nr:hypothetical protein [Akkermansiaceae bacterium]
MKKWAVIVCVLVTIGGFIAQSFDSFEGTTLAEEVSISSTYAKPSLRVITRSLFHKEYAAENGSIENDLEAVSFLLTDCQLIIKNFDTFFLPDNEAITSFLRGANPERTAWISPDHSSVNREGELLDRNGIPILFHRESSSRIQIRSAGKDRVMWTSDDVVYPDRKTLSKAN